MLCRHLYLMVVKAVGEYQDEIGGLAKGKRMDLGLTGKVAIVTGGTANIGRAIVLALVAWLASDQTSWVTEQVMQVDGGALLR